MMHRRIEDGPLAAGRSSRRAFLRAAGAGVGGLIATSCRTGLQVAPRERRVVFVAGARSHGFGEHEHEAGCRLLADRLAASGGVHADVFAGGWPDDDAFTGVDAVVFYGDGDDHHPMAGHEELVDRLAARGVGLGFLHYALIPPDDRCHPRMLDWIGGYYEPWWSVNPIWRADVTALPAHPVTRGVRPFAIDDEWYYHMRFRPELRGVVPLLTAVPPDSTRHRESGPHSGNEHVAARDGQPEHLAWAATRAGGGRGFGFTGGHWHWNWAHDDYRTIVLNAVAWLAGIEVPERGIPSATPTLDELLAGLPEPPASFDAEPFERLLAGWRVRGAAPASADGGR
ncbi:MAG: ThuA domain-containing protein [Planctomycetes bacterium]|nr:ThuA domain-containing protein [Planctomycetota bacterium]